MQVRQRKEAAKEEDGGRYHPTEHVPNSAADRDPGSGGGHLFTNRY